LLKAMATIHMHDEALHLFQGLLPLASVCAELFRERQGVGNMIYAMECDALP
jgi:hypothetical protein